MTPDPATAWLWIRRAIAAVPQLRVALGVIALAAAFSVARVFAGGSIVALVVAVVIMLGLAVLVVLFAHFVEKKTSKGIRVDRLIQALLWVFVGGVIVYATLATTSFWFGSPLDFRPTSHGGKETGGKETPSSGDSMPARTTIIGSVNQSGGVTTQNISVGATEWVDFEGNHHVNRSGGSIQLLIQAAPGPESKAYGEMFTAQAAKSWAELERAAGSAISSYPSWPTGYVFLGVAEANLGNFDLAVAKLTQAEEVARASGVPDEYQEAGQEARKLLDQLHALGH